MNVFYPKFSGHINVFCNYLEGILLIYFVYRQRVFLWTGLLILNSLYFPTFPNPSIICILRFYRSFVFAYGDEKIATYNAIYK